MYEKVSTGLNFVDREKEVEKFWKDHDIFQKSIELREGCPTYMFYDGPPTANGKPHIGHVLTRVIKDMIPRYRTMKGYRVPRKAGWDTHGLPVELDEAAMVDGANEFQVFYKIIIPLAMPQLAVIFLFSFIATYSEYVITSIFLQTPGKMTLALGLQSFISDQFAAHWTLFAAAAVISSLPIMIIFMCLQRFIQNGLVAGGVKG